MSSKTKVLDLSWPYSRAACSMVPFIARRHPTSVVEASETFHDPPPLGPTDDILYNTHAHSAEADVTRAAKQRRARRMRAVEIIGPCLDISSSGRRLGSCKAHWQ